MTVEEAEAYVYQSYLRAEKHQPYGARDSEKRTPDLTRGLIRRFSGTPCAVITGSKGKGSAALMISKILGMKMSVGLMTSPHLVDFRERFRVDGEKISPEDFVRHMEAVRPDLDRIGNSLPEDVCISPMGIQTLLALSWFRERGTGFNVLECGKGAKYDDVNSALHEYAVINSIFPEHTRELGATCEEIAADKASVITGEQRCVLTAAQRPGVMEVIRRRAEECGTRLLCYGEDFRAERIWYTPAGMRFDVAAGDRRYEDLFVPLLGEHQAYNCALAVALGREVLGDVDPDGARRCLASLIWPGRMEILRADPFVMVDACVNPAACGYLREVLGRAGIGRAAVVIGIPDDKDYAGVARKIRDLADRIILAGSANPHYRFTPEQEETLRREGIRAEWIGTVAGALREAERGGGPIVILGTASVVAEARTYYGAEGV